MDEHNEWQFILAYVKDSTTYFHNEACRNQFIALWTSYCLHNNLKVGTTAYDAVLMDLFNILSDDQKSALRCYRFVEFEEMMAQWLV